MTQPVAKFNYKAYNIEALNYRQGRFVQDILGVPHFASLNDTRASNETIVIPCFHPGYQGHTGILREKVQQIFKLVSAIGWYAITAVLRISRDNPHASRRMFCLKVFQDLKTTLNTSNALRNNLDIAKREYLVALKAYRQGELTRRNALDLPKPPKGILAKKTDFTRRTRTLTNNQVGSDGSGGYEVLIQEQIVNGPKGDNVRYSLTWSEEDAESWTVGPIILPEHVTSPNDNDKRFIFL